MNHLNAVRCILVFNSLLYGHFWFAHIWNISGMNGRTIGKLQYWPWGKLENKKKNDRIPLQLDSPHVVISSHCINFNMTRCKCHVTNIHRGMGWFCWLIFSKLTKDKQTNKQNTHIYRWVYKCLGLFDVQCFQKRNLQNDCSPSITMYGINIMNSCSRISLKK